MNLERAAILRAATEEVGLPVQFAETLIADAPWLDATDEINEELAAQLLADASALSLASAARLQAFATAYNARVRESQNPHAVQQTLAYAELTHSLASLSPGHWVAKTDYWLVEDSFCSRTPVLQLLTAAELPAGARTALQRFLEQHCPLFDEVRICTADGELIHSVRR